MSENGQQKVNEVEKTATEPIIELAWTTLPAKKHPARTLLVSLFLLVITGIVYSMTSSAFFAALALVVLFASIAKFYLPTRFTLTDREIIIKSTTQTIKKEWSQFRSFYPDKNGVLVSPFVGPSRLENFRGVYLIFGNNRDAVLRILKGHIGVDAQGEV